MDELIKQLNTVLADSYVTYLKAHGYHWNIEGRDFYQLHKLLELIYEEIQEAIDDIGEQVRQINGRAIHTLLEFDSYKTIPDMAVMDGHDNTGMLADLNNANLAVLASLYRAHEMAENQKEFALSNFLQDRMMAHKKHAWMLKTTLEAGQ